MSAKSQSVITPQTVENAMSYNAYRKMIDDLLAEGKTTGPKQSEAMTEYTRKNVQMMSKLDEEVRLNNSLKETINQVERSMIWLVITEGWCGDAAQSIPVIHKIAEVSSNIELKLILRDENLDIMDEYLTNGGRSIPKLVCLDGETLEELGTWGPRPGNFQQKAMAWKDDPEIDKKEWVKKLHSWYEEDQSQTIQNDFEQLVDRWD